jgi:hypothetical protein
MPNNDPTPESDEASSNPYQQLRQFALDQAAEQGLTEEQLRNLKEVTFERWDEEGSIRPSKSIDFKLSPEQQWLFVASSVPIGNFEDPYLWTTNDSQGDDLSDKDVEQIMKEALDCHVVRVTLLFVRK